MKNLMKVILNKKTYCKDCPVIVFGGSYGGILATWMRMKYPFNLKSHH